MGAHGRRPRGMNAVAYVAAAAFMLIVACGGQQSPAPTPAGSSQAAAAAQTQAATTAPADPRSRPTSTPLPTPLPTARPLPTAEPPTVTAIETPTPIASPTPTARETVGTATPEPAAATPTISAEARQLAGTLDEIGRRVSDLRELPVLRPIERQFMTREELGVRFRKELDEERDDIDEGQRLYAALGILKEDDDLFEIILDLLSEGVLGFYDAEEERFYIVQDASQFGPADVTTYAHEFVHGLQQQHFDFHAKSESLEDNSDASFALRALIEGDATLTESAYIQLHMTAAERANSEAPISAALLKAFRATPHVIQREFIFPYREGTDFVTTIYQRGGWAAVSEAFERVPQSTEQVLHPEKYRSGEPPIQVEVPDILSALGDGWELLSTDTLGEFVLLAYLETGSYAQDPDAAADGWGGDQYKLYIGPQNETVLVMSIEWDTERDAREFFEAFLQFTAARTGGLWEVLAGEADARLMELAGQSIGMSLEGRATLVIIAPDGPIFEQVRSELG